MRRIHAFYRLLLLFSALSLLAWFAGLLHNWQQAVLMTMSLLFFSAGIGHFSPLRRDFEQMIPPFIPMRKLLVVITGIIEVVGAICLQISGLEKPTAAFLIFFLFAVFPANYYAAAAGVKFRGAAHMGFVERGILQVLFMVALYVGAFGLNG